MDKGVYRQCLVDGLMDMAPQENTPPVPEKALWLAVLMEAVRSLAGRAVGGESRDLERSLARQWFSARHRDPPTGSFQWIAEEVFEVDTDRLGVMCRRKAVLMERRATE